MDSDLAPAPETTGLARAATIVALGNVASRLLGLVRETVKSDLFGATGPVSAFQVAAIVPTMLYDLLVGGMVSSALVPVFSEYAAPERREELWRLAGLLLGLITVVLSAFVLAVELFAPQVAWLLSGGFDQALLDQTASLLRITVPAVLFLNISGVLAGLLYALRRFSLPAFTAAVFNAAIVVAALLLGRGPLGVTSLAIGLLVGAMLQVAVQLPGLRGTHLRLSFDWRQAGVRRILRLYVPIVLGLVVSQVVIGLSYNLASRTGAESIAWMNYATTLFQFPLGLVSTAVSLAILPTLSRQGAAAFVATLAQGLKLVLLLIIPATIGLFVLAHPIVVLIFEHGSFTPGDSDATALVLRTYLLGLTFAAIDLPLVYAFYARKDTLTPALVGLAGVGIYLLAALAPTLARPLRVTDLALANGIQLTAHALIMLWLLERRVGSLRDTGAWRVAAQALGAAVVLGGVAYGIGQWLGPFLPGSLIGETLAVALPGGAGLLVYGAIILALRVPEAQLVLNSLVRPLSGIMGRRAMPERSVPRDGQQPSLPSTLYTQDYFLEACEGYEEYLASQGEHLSRRLASAFQVAGVAPGMKVLDVGCGRGEILRHCAELGARAYGVDYSAAAVNLAREAADAAADGSRQIGVYQADAKRLPFPDGAFDRVLLFDVVEHLYPWELQQALAEVRRVLRPGGRIAVHTAPNRWYDAYAYPFVRFVRTIMGEGARYPANPRALNVAVNVDVHVNEQDPLSLRRALQATAFERVRVWLDSPPQSRQEGTALAALRRIAFGWPPFRWFFERELFAVGEKGS
jgi:putative peptidoglycan lipid II flippase